MPLTTWLQSWPYTYEHCHQNFHNFFWLSSHNTLTYRYDDRMAVPSHTCLNWYGSSLSKGLWLMTGMYSIMTCCQMWIWFLSPYFSVGKKNVFPVVRKWCCGKILLFLYHMSSCMHDTSNIRSQYSLRWRYRICLLLCIGKNTGLKIILFFFKYVY